MTELFKHDLILQFCKNKKVLHIGATDAPYHKEKGLKEELLHQKLQKVCKKLVGIDIDKKAIKYLKEKFGINNIFYGDIIKNKYKVKLTGHWDYIVFGDVIEHLENPGLALENIKKLMNKNTYILLTAPNVFGYSNFICYFTGKEVVHPDHTFWTSYKTLSHLLEIKGLKTEYFTYCFCGSYNNIRTLKRKFFYKILKNKINHIKPCLFFILKKL